MKLLNTPYYHRYQDEALNEFFLGKVGDALKKASDRVFRDLPKSIVNAVTAPFVAKPPYSLNQFQDKKYGEAATNEKNRKIVGTVGSIAIGVLTAGAGTAATTGLTAGKVFNAASIIGSAVNQKQAAGQTPEVTEAPQVLVQPITVDDSEKKKVFFIASAGIILIIVITIILLQ